MKHGFRLTRAALLAAVLSMAGQARAMSAPSVNHGNDGVPAWYSVVGNGPRRPAREAAAVGERGVPAWYSVMGIPRPAPPREPAAVVMQRRPVPSWYAIG